MLDAVDYTKGFCAPDIRIGTALPAVTLLNARKALADVDLSRLVNRPADKPL